MLNHNQDFITHIHYSTTLPRLFDYLPQYTTLLEKKSDSSFLATCLLEDYETHLVIKGFISTIHHQQVGHLMFLGILEYSMSKKYQYLLIECTELS